MIHIYQCWKVSYNEFDTRNSTFCTIENKYERNKLMIFTLCTNINKFTYEKIKKYPFYNSFTEERQKGLQRVIKFNTGYILSPSFEKHPLKNNTSSTNTILRSWKYKIKFPLVSKSLYRIDIVKKMFTKQGTFLLSCKNCNARHAMNSLLALFGAPAGNESWQLSESRFFTVLKISRASNV